MHVTAIVVVRDGPERIAAVAGAVRGQSRRPDRVVAVDALHDADATEVLRAGLGPDAHLTWVERGSSLAVAVTAGLEVADAGQPTGASDGEEWLWFLTDDAAPAPDVLDLLLAEVETSPSVAVAGCSGVSWDDDQQLLDVGLSVTPLGSRIRGVDLREVAQGQHDERSDVYAVPLAGLLVRRATLDAVGGFDAALQGARDDLDLCRRVHLAGHRVVVVPRARVARYVPAPASAAGADRHDAVHLRLVQARLWLLLPALAWTLVAVPTRAAWRMVLKQPGPALAEVAGALASLASPIDVVRARVRQRRARRVPRRVLTALRPPPREVWWQRREDLTAYRFWAGAFDETDDALRLPSRRSPGLPVTSLTDAEAEADVGLVPVSVLRHPPLVAGTVVVLATLVAGVVAARGLLRGSGAAVAGPGLLPAPEHLRRLWADAVSTWRPVGLGRSALADPFDQVLALLSLPLGASPRLAVLAVLVLAVPLATWTAWLAAGAVTRSRLLRPWAALTWGASPVLLLAAHDGRLGELLAHALLPLLLLAIARAAGVPRWRAPLQVPATGVTTSLLAAAAARDAAARRPRPSLTAASAAGLLVTAEVACAPWSAVPLALVLLATAVAAPGALRMPRRARRRARGVLGWTALVAAAGIAPWWWQVASHPRLLLADTSSAGAASDLAGATVPTAPARSLGGVADLLVGRAGRAVDLLGGEDGRFAGRLTQVLPDGWGRHSGDVLAGVLVAAALPALVLAVLALVAAGRRRPVALLGGLLAVAGAGVWVASTRVAGGRVAETASGAWAGCGLSLVGAGVLLAALIGADALRRRVRRAPSAWLRVPLAGLAAAALLLGPTVSLGAWAWTAPDEGGTARVDPDVMTVVGKAEAEGPAATRTLVLRVGDTVEWSLLREPGPAIGQRSAAWALAGGDARDADVLGGLLGRLLSDTGADVRPALSRLAIGTIMLRTPVDPAAQASLDASPGLVRSGTDDDAVLTWRVDLDSARGPTRPARAWLEEDTATSTAAVTDRAGEDRLEATLPAGGGNRLLVLAERADAGWRATLDGHRLTPRTASGWAQAFEVPAAGGRLVVRHRDVTTWRLQRLSWAALVLAALVAIPVPRRRRPPAPPRPSRPVSRVDLGPSEQRSRPSGVAEEEALERWATGVLETLDAEGVGEGVGVGAGDGGRLLGDAYAPDWSDAQADGVDGVDGVDVRAATDEHVEGRAR